MDCIYIYNTAQSGTSISCLLPPRIRDYDRREQKGLQESETVDVCSQALLARHETPQLPLAAIAYRRPVQDQAN